MEGVNEIMMIPEMSSDINALLGRFAKVLEEFKTLSPLREFDHHILLKEEAKQVNVASYRYAYYHKVEIEKQVGEILANGLILPNTSSFSSPILLVKKKDSSWRFFTNYRALNEATINDTFLIPTIDDILDEL